MLKRCRFVGVEATLSLTSTFSVDSVQTLIQRRFAIRVVGAAERSKNSPQIPARCVGMMVFQGSLSGTGVAFRGLLTFVIFGPFAGLGGERQGQEQQQRH